MQPTAESVRSIVATLRSARAGERVESMPAGIELAVLDGPDEGTHRVLADEVLVGRGKLCGLRLTDPSISEFHFKLSVAKGEVHLEDIGSRNGVWCGRARVKRATLLPGAVFQAGSCRFRLEEIETSPRAMTTRGEFHGLYAESKSMRAIFALLGRISPTPMPVLVTGETGCGKGMVAKAIHEASGRRGKFVTLDCTSLPREMAEALILGHAKGAFTGAHEARSSPFEEANNGTLFLDEIGELPVEMQAVLLRIVEEQAFTRVGGHSVRHVDVRVVAATNRELEQEVTEGRFRADLLHRLACIPIKLPPLRTRPADIAELANRFLAQVADELDVNLRFEDEAIEKLRQLDWPGNVRELKQTVKRSAYLADGNAISPDALFLTGHSGDMPVLAEVDGSRPPDALPPLEEVLDRSRREYCAALLKSTDSIATSAKISGYTPRGLRMLLKRLGIELPGHFRRTPRS